MATANEELARVQPLGENLLVRRLLAPEKTAGGIILPDQARNTPGEGIVVAAGPGKQLEDGTVTPCRCKVGDRILFPIYSMQDVKIGLEQLMVIPECEVLAIVEIPEPDVQAGTATAVTGGVSAGLI